MQENYLLKRHRWSALWNGVVIGMGVGTLMALGANGVLGILPLGLGIAMEVLQRKRLNNAG